ncbi:hypothetical protein POF50_022255 [Streptomyces sp. SL13]|uniref:Uncharacterized protein n=1 Tax=Streptantibioticus silvisoli TaxID=2705255 RepID=A0AA90H6T9_9ACTN|nr:hypothetical protein [Streptantibioticus silvisoli]MDI5965389.1 hypothetical protein [Streptantibioticus silvisoli]MDI5972025.1 hypothetical protein [Streptantibioticus silvisoli]
MAKEPRKSPPAHGEGPGPHKGTEQHGWSPDVDSTKGRHDNPSAHRSFHPDEYAPPADPHAEPSKEDVDASLRDVPGETGKSISRSGQDHADSGQKGHHAHGRRGHSQRPSGGKDSSAYTGVDPQDPPSGKH